MADGEVGVAEVAACLAEMADLAEAEGLVQVAGLAVDLEVDSEAVSADTAVDTTAAETTAGSAGETKEATTEDMGPAIAARRESATRATRRFTRGSSPMSPGFRGNEMRGERFNRFRRREFGGFGGWGWWLGGGYWGFDDPWWYGGFPFWYADLGYADYGNPYYDMNPWDYANYDYGMPIPQASIDLNPGNDHYFAAAREAFSAGNYQAALQDITQAIEDLPGNQDVHEFFALTLFALGDYNKAAAVTYDVLNAGPGWDWTILQSFYSSPDVYRKQLRALEHYVTEHAQQAGPRFLLADHYLMLGHFQAAEHQLQAVVSLEPRDKLSQNILAALKHAPGVETSQCLGPGQARTAPVSLQALEGTWHAHPTPYATVDLSLQPNHTFTWTVSNNGQSQAFSGDLYPARKRTGSHPQ